MENIEKTLQAVKEAAKEQKAQDIKVFLQSPQVIERFSEFFGEKNSREKPKTAAFVSSVISIVKNNSLLREATFESILFAALAAAAVNLPISEQLGFAYIVPYKTKVKKKVNGKDVWTEEVRAQFQVGWKGFVQLAIRSGQFKKIVVRPVYKGQLIGYDPKSGEELFDFSKKESDEVIGYRAYFQLLNGFEQQLYMTKEQIEQHALKYSASYQYDKKVGKQTSVWSKDFDAMAKKTVLKLLLSRYGLLSTEIQSAVVYDQATNLNEYADNPERAQSEDLKEWIQKAETAGELEMLLPLVETSEDEEVKTLYNEKLEQLKEPVKVSKPKTQKEEQAKLLTTIDNA